MEKKKEKKKENTISVEQKRERLIWWVNEGVRKNNFSFLLCQRIHKPSQVNSSASFLPPLKEGQNFATSQCCFRS